VDGTAGTSIGRPTIKSFGRIELTYKDFSLSARYLYFRYDRYRQPLNERKYSMEDADEKKLKAEIDEIIKKVNAIVKNIEELDPAKKEEAKQIIDEQIRSS
jgi:cell division protein FtsB